MGLFVGLLTLPLAPVRGVIWLAEQIEAEAERQRADSDDPLRELTALEIAFEAGEIDEHERLDREEELFSRLDAGGLGDG